MPPRRGTAKRTGAEAPLKIAGQVIEPGHSYNLQLAFSQNYTGIEMLLPVRVVAGPQPGPRVFLTAVVHGDELNGLGVLRELLFERPLRLQCGVVVAAPVVNIYGLENHSRYLPDRRDLNRAFPGSPRANLASRLAHLVYSEIIRHCDYGLDFHTAAVRRTNYPNVRADLDNPAVRELAHAYGSELLVHTKGAEGTLRRVASQRGIPTIVIEAGEVWKIEPGVIRLGVRGTLNVLRHLGMVKGPARRPPQQLEIRRTAWVRAEHGGILKFHAMPGDVVHKGQILATNTTIFGHPQHAMKSPANGVVLGVTTMPAVKPGEPVYHIALSEEPHHALLRRLGSRRRAGLHQQVQDDLATNLLRSDQPD